MVMASSHLIMLLITLLHLFLGLTVAGQETVVLHNNIHETTSIAATVAESELFNVSSSIVLAEMWLRNHVLSHYPSSNITSIVIGEDLFCNTLHQHRWSLVLPSVKNLHYSLVRWGLVRDIKASIAFSHDCFKHAIADTYLKPVLSFLQDSNSVYTINPPPHFEHSPRSTGGLISTHERALSYLGFSHLKIAVLGKQGIQRTRTRKLISSSFASSPYPEKPKPSDFQNQPPIPMPLPPSPDTTLSFIPSASPSEIPPDAFVYPPSSSPSSSSPFSSSSPSPSSSPSFTSTPSPLSSTSSSIPSPSPYTYSSPPCPAFHPATPSPVQSGGGEKDGLWCVAKPAVPAETLQKGIDFACGKGGADCAEIGPKGSCYYPDNVVAHASYAYNSYWQKTKTNGGSCGFDATAILIDADPSFLHCRFELRN